MTRLDSKALLTAALVATFAVGCSGRGAGGLDKAGGAAPRGVLTLADADPPTVEEAQLAREYGAAVERLSHGALKVHLRFLAGGTAAEGEQRTIELVRSGKADIGMVPARAWDQLGVRSFQALQAPFLITNYALLDKVLRSPLAEQMLAGLDTQDVVPLTLLPGVLRHPYGVRAPIVSLSDYAGAKIRDYPSRVTDGLLNALGAVPTHLDASAVPSAETTGALDGQELALYIGPSEGVATANVTFFPKTVTLFANSQAFSRLTRANQNLLAAAARTTLRANSSYPISASLGFEQTLINSFCRAGGRAALATPAQLAELVRAARPVYAQLQKDAQTRRAIATIRAIAASLPPAPALSAPRACLASATPPPRETPTGSELNGTYRRVLTASDAQRFGSPATDPSNSYPLVITTVLRDGRWLENSSAPPSTGRYAATGDRISFTLGADTMHFTFTRDADGTLHLHPVQPIDSGDAFVMAFEPWRRLGPPIMRLP